MRALATLLLAGGLVVPMDIPAIQEALTIANSSLESTRDRFHADYSFRVNRPPIDFINIVSPFRRVVLLGETERRLGRRMFGQREALAALRPDPDRFEVYVELTFHPHNTFIGVPDYSVELEPMKVAADAISATELQRFPRFTTRLETDRYPFPFPYQPAPQAPSGSTPLQGGTLIARFDGRSLDPKASYTVLVRDGRRELTRASIDFGRLR